MRDSSVGQRSALSEVGRRNAHFEGRHVQVSLLNAFECSLFGAMKDCVITIDNVSPFIFT